MTSLSLVEALGRYLPSLTPSMDLVLLTGTEYQTTDFNSEVLQCKIFFKTLHLLKIVVFLRGVQ